MPDCALPAYIICHFPLLLSTMEQLSVWGSVLRHLASENPQLVLWWTVMRINVLAAATAARSEQKLAAAGVGFWSCKCSARANHHQSCFCCCVNFSPPEQSKNQSLRGCSSSAPQPGYSDVIPGLPLVQPSCGHWINRMTSDGCLATMQYTSAQTLPPDALLWQDAARRQDSTSDSWMSGCLCGVSVFRSRNVKKLLAMVSVCGSRDHLWIPVCGILISSGSLSG